MIQGRSITFTIAQMGSLNTDEAQNATKLANQVQRAFNFVWYHRLFSLDKKRYRLPNSGFDLDMASKELLQRLTLPRPLILVTSMPYGTQAMKREPEYFFFAEENLFDDEENPVSIVSTYLWERLPGLRRLQPYLLFMLATIVLHHRTGLVFHDETYGCLFDYCDDPQDIDHAFEVGHLCGSCERHLQTKLRNGNITIEQVSAVKKLFNRALGKKVYLEEYHKLVVLQGEAPETPASQAGQGEKKKVTKPSLTEKALALSTIASLVERLYRFIIWLKTFFM